MKRININQGWQMTKESPAGYYPMQGQINGNTEVNLPHDCNIDEEVARDCPDGMNVAYFKGNMAVYTKQLEIAKEWMGQKVYLELDGSYCNTEITLNGHLIAIHPNGYTPFACDLTDYLNYGGKNRLAIFVNNSMMRTSRWYSGTGIYRDVDLRVGPLSHLSINPLFVTTQCITKDQALLRIQVEVENHDIKDKKLSAVVKLFKDQGRNAPVSDEVIAESHMILVPEKGKTMAESCTMVVENPELWDLENPNLYLAKVELYDGGELIDTDSTLCGIRTISVDAVNGLLLNGSGLKIKGGCMHHDNGLLGAASFYDSEYRRLKLHKDNGYNSIRGAHNPMSRDMLEACDRLGLLMFAEAFDVWRMQKNCNDYHLFFEDWWKRDLTAFIKRDRNHPSIYIWSIGNEITERNNLKDAAKYSHKLSAHVRSLDASRPITAGIPGLYNGMDDADTMKQLESMGGPDQDFNTPFSQGIWADRTEAFCAPLDVVGYNYLENRYEMDHEIYPTRVICGAESYAKSIDKIWELVEKLPYVIGDYTWTSQDYLGEVTCGNIIYRDPQLSPIGMQLSQIGGGFPARTANCSDFDICGNDMAALHYRKIVWGSDETYIAVMNPKNFGLKAYHTPWAWDECYNHWCFPGDEGHDVGIEIYSAADEVELLVNGESFGCVAAGKENRFKAKFETVYQPGTLEAISYTAGKEVSRQILKTPGEPENLKVTAEKEILKADGQSLSYISIEVVDKNGNLVPYISEEITATVTGAGTLAAFGSSIPKTAELYTTGVFTSYQGRLQAIVRSGYDVGKIEFSVCSEKLGKHEVVILAKVKG